MDVLRIFMFTWVYMMHSVAMWFMASPAVETFKAHSYRVMAP